MEHLLHLHPIFEFYLSVYFAIIIAPEFSLRILIERLHYYLKRSQNKIANKIKGYLKRIDELEKKFKSESIMDKELVIADGLKSQTNLSFLLETKNQILEMEKQINDEQINDAAKLALLAGEIRKCYDKVFPFAMLYCFFVLIFNGCYWASENEMQEVRFMVSISYFNLFCSGFILLLIYWKKSINTKIKLTHLCNQIGYNNFASLGLISLFLYTSFWVISFPIVPFSNRYAFFWTTISAVSLGAAPLVTFTLELRLQSIKYFNANYSEKIRIMNYAIDASNIDSFNLIKK